MELPPGLKEKYARLESVRNELQVVILRRQQIEAELRDVAAALREIEKLKSSGRNIVIYKSFGPLLVRANEKEIEEELKEKQEILKVRLDTLKKQEAQLRKQYESLAKRLREEVSSSGAG